MDHAKRPRAARLELFEPLPRRGVFAFRWGGRKRFLRVLLRQFQKNILTPFEKQTTTQTA